MSWQPIATAPKGTHKTITSGEGRTREQFVPQWVHAWKPGMEVTMSYFLPKENRWMAFTTDAPPTHWHEVPKPPEAA